MSSAKPGDRVRATFTGTVEWDCSLKTALQVRPDKGNWAVMLQALDEVEVVEPEYIVGEVYQDAKGDKYQRLPGKNLGWRPVKAWQYSRACDVGQDYPTRPLVRLVPENG